MESMEDTDRSKVTDDVGPLKKDEELVIPEAIKNDGELVTETGLHESKSRDKGTSKLKRKMPTHPPTSEAVLEPTKGLKKRKGVSTKVVSKHTEENYGVDMKTPRRQDKGTSKLKRKMPTHPPTSEMVLETMKRLKNRKGVSTTVLSKHIEENYNVEMKTLRRHINTFLKKAVDKGMLEQVSGTDANGSFKIKTEGIKGGQKLTRKVESVRKREIVPAPRKRKAAN